MPEVGEIRPGLELGYKSNTKNKWSPCGICGVPRWVQVNKNGESKIKRCLKCSWIGKHHSTETKIQMSKDRKRSRFGSYSPSWKGGRVRGAGYISIKLLSGDFFFPMADSHGYVMEHRLVVAKSIGRCLQPFPFEVVHHKNGDRLDNRLENLELTAGNGEHIADHSRGYKDGYQKGYLDGHDKRIKELLLRIKTLENRHN